MEYYGNIIIETKTKQPRKAGNTMKDFLTLKNNNYIHVNIEIEHKDGKQRFVFSQDYKYASEGVYVTFKEKDEKRMCWKNETDTFTPEEANDLFNTLMNTSKWIITFERTIKAKGEH